MVFLSEQDDSFRFPFQSIILEITKLSQSIQAALLFGSPVSSRIELLAALMELLSARILDVQEHGRFVFRRFNPRRDSFEWCKPYPLTAVDFDVASLRATLCAIKEISGDSALGCSSHGSKIEISEIKNLDAVRSSSMFSIILSFSLLDCVYGPKDTLVLKARYLNG